jgi:hypothetical protein
MPLISTKLTINSHHISLFHWAKKKIKLKEEGAIMYD